MITYDDSDGWYDHQVSPIVNGSDTAADAAICTSARLRWAATPTGAASARGCRCW